MKRTFIALNIPVPDNLLKQIFAFREELKGLIVKWVEPHNYHLTLAFLGDTTPVQIQNISVLLQAIVCKYKPFNFRFNEIGAFKSLKNPQVIWLGGNEPENLGDIVAEIRLMLVENGLEPEQKKFKAHLTLGRVKEVFQHNLEKLSVGFQPELLSIIPADTLVFYESTLTQSGPIYKPIRIYKLS